MRKSIPILVLAAVGAASWLCWPADPRAAPVPAVAETDPVPSDGDAADDVAIWVCPRSPERSLIVGTDKDGGIAVYDLDGRELQFLARGERFNNVDLRDGFPLDGETVALVAAGETTRDQIVLFSIDEEKRRLTEIPGSRIHLGIEPEGTALYRDSRGEFSVFAVGDARDGDEEGVVEQWAVRPGTRVPIESELVRRFELGSTAEGIVADDETGRVYIAEEERGIWEYPADPMSQASGRLVAQVAPDALHGDVEGLAILRGPRNRYLIASSQGSDDFVVYRLGDELVRMGRFEVAGGSIDPVTHCDGIDVVSVPLGPRFPDGLFACQDDENDGGNQNFKLVSVRDIVRALDLEL